jgi:hypothetical protein
MVPEFDCSQIEEAVKASLRGTVLVYTGDKGQLGPIEYDLDEGDLPPAFKRHLDKQGNLDKHGHIAELTERVRQTEGDPILDLAEPFWQKAVGNLPEVEKF